ncbi:MAG: hypothetical protein ACE5H9_13800 [Anaerolineae bacterium]
MPKLAYKNELPPADEFQKALAEAMTNTNPIDDLLELANDLWEFEQKYQMPSADFYEKYQMGSLDDELQHCIEWVATYDFFMKTKRKLETALMRAAVQPEVSEPAS